MKKKTKICSKCKQEKSLNKFGKDKNKKDKLQAHCKNCERRSRLAREYNITEKQYQDIFDLQNGCCAICRRHQSKLKRELAVDHNHKTNIIRGLLCDQCNMTLGHYEKQREECKKYLRETPKRIIPLYKQWLEVRNK